MRQVADGQFRIAQILNYRPSSITPTMLPNTAPISRCTYSRTSLPSTSTDPRVRSMYVVVAFPFVVFSIDLQCNRGDLQCSLTTPLPSLLPRPRARNLSSVSSSSMAHFRKCKNISSFSQPYYFRTSGSISISSPSHTQMSGRLFIVSPYG